MALKDLVIPTVDVEFAGGSFPVRGLAAYDLEILMRDHGNDLKAIWDEFLKDGTDLTKLEVGAIMPMLGKLVTRLPAAFIDVIAIAADADAEDRVKLAKLSVGVQTYAVSTILGVTLGTDGDWSKTLETVLTMVEGANGALSQMLKNKAEG